MFRSAAEHVDSYYAATSRPSQRPRPPLQEGLDVDVCVVGAGFFGLYCALELARAGRSVAVLEASRIGWGASGRNGGQLTPGLACGLPALCAAMGEARAHDIYRESLRALASIRALIDARAIDCDLVDGHVEVAVLPRRVHLLAEAPERAARWGHEGLRFIDRAELPRFVDSPRYLAGLLDPAAAHLHPLKYVLGLADAAEAAGAVIHEGTRVAGYDAGGDAVAVRLANGAVVRCGQLVLAAGAYVDGLDRERAARVLPVGTFIGATEVLGEALCRSLIPGRHAIYDNQFILEYFRTTPDHRLLFGGRCTYLGGTPHDLAGAMKSNIVRAFPQLREAAVEYAWGGHIDITLRRTPDWGRRGDRVYWAQGFCGHGLVPTRVAATVVTEAMLGAPERLDAFAAFANPRFPGGERLGGLAQALGMSWFRLRDLV